VVALNSHEALIENLLTGFIEMLTDLQTDKQKWVVGYSVRCNSWL